MDWVKSGQLGHAPHIMHLKSISNLNFLRTWNTIVLVRIHLGDDQEIIHVPFLKTPTSFDSPPAIRELSIRHIL
jgi:hypothetical protein